jgi:glutathione peroxidase
MASLGDFQARSADGSDVDLSVYYRQVVLVVNNPTRCGLAGQFERLQELHDTYADRGFAVLGFPSDQFLQEPVDNEDMSLVCARDFGVSFPMFAKVAVNGREADPLFRWLRSEHGGLLGQLVGDRIKWNFTKFLVDRDGQVVGRYAPTTDPVRLTGDIEAALAA